MVIFLRKAHTILYLITVFVFFILCYPFLFFYTRNPKKYYNQIARCRRWICVNSAYCLGFRFKIEYEVDIDWSKNYVLCPNHTSILDITALTCLCPVSFSFIGKVELLKNPVTRTFFKSIDITVDRSNRLSAFKAFKEADRLIKDKKSIVIFPEGKIDDEYPPQLHEFKSGSFRLAVDNQTQIIPIVISDAWKLLWDGGQKLGSKPGTVHIKVLTPIDTTGSSNENSDWLQHTVFHKMKEEWVKSNVYQKKKNEIKTLKNNIL